MKVLCAVDGSGFSRWGVEALSYLGDRPPKILILLHALDIEGLKASGRRGKVNVSRSLAAVMKEGDRLVRQSAQLAALALSQRPSAASTKIETAVVKGPPAGTIVRQAKKRRADLLVVGSRGLSDLQGFLLGSISRKVTAQAPCPVLVVKERMPDTPKIVLAVDSSKYSKAAAEFLRRHLAGESTQLSIVSIVPPVATDIAARVLSAAELEDLAKPVRERARVVVAKFREAFLKDGCSVTTEVLAGHPTQTILDYLEKVRPAMVVMGSRGLTGTERLQLGSVSESVLKYAPCSVLVVRGRTA